MSRNLSRNDVVEGLRLGAASLPDDGSQLIREARRRAMEAVRTVAAAVQIDPTLAEPDRSRDIELIGELLRQLRSLMRQAEIELTRLRTGRQERTNPLAPDELDAMSRRAVELAERVSAAALPDWNTPKRIRERSRRLLPDERELAEIADRLRAAVRPALELPYPAAEAVRLAMLADEITTGGRPRQDRCAAPGCDRPLQHAATGRRRRFCGPACRQRARRFR